MKKSWFVMGCLGAAFLAQAMEWKYTLEQPAEDWYKPEFKDASWKKGESPFGVPGTPNIDVKTEWRTKNIWMRRAFVLETKKKIPRALLMIHDEDATVYINGVEAAAVPNYSTGYVVVPVAAEAARALKAGRNVIAVRCRQTKGAQAIDVGVIRVQ